jgi:uncharacterized membrane protein
MRNDLRSETMASDRLVLCMGVYKAAASAELDYADLKLLYGSGRLGAYDVAVVTRADDGAVHVHKREKSTQHGAWKGVAAGAALGVIFPPSVLVSATALGAAGGLTGHFRKGLSRDDMTELGEALRPGEAAMLVVAGPDVEAQAERVLSRADRRLVKKVDVRHEEFAEDLAAITARDPA